MSLLLLGGKTPMTLQRAERPLDLIRPFPGSKSLLSCCRFMQCFMKPSPFPISTHSKAILQALSFSFGLHHQET